MSNWLEENTNTRDTYGKNGKVDNTKIIDTSCFTVWFFIRGLVPNPHDYEFRSVKGLSSKIRTKDIRSGGEDEHLHRVPDVITHENLVLERGIIKEKYSGMFWDSPLSIDCFLATTFFRFSPGNALIMLHDNSSDTPQAAWLFRNTYPVQWSFSDLGGSKNKSNFPPAIEHIELAYSHFSRIF